MTTISLLSNEGGIVNFPRDVLQYTGFLEMLHRRHHGDGPIKTGIDEFDLKLTETICVLGCFPQSYPDELHPVGFPSLKDLADYMIIENAFGDTTSDLLNDFLFHMGLGEFQTVKGKHMKPKRKHVRPTVEIGTNCQMDDVCLDQILRDEYELFINRWMTMSIEPMVVEDDTDSDFYFDD